jgi:choline dehydrogenase-like flavoprotein
MLPLLYQDRGLRHTRDLAFIVLQGRAVGGGSNINWTSCFRPPATVLRQWVDRSGLAELEPDRWEQDLAAVERRLEVQPVADQEHNPNNQVLLAGAAKLGWQRDRIHRNVTGCVRSGFCGLGCSYDAKRSIPLTYLRDALAAGAELYAEVQVERVLEAGGRVRGVAARSTAGAELEVEAPIVVVAGGAIHSPALLLRSGLGRRLPRIGRATFLHPTVVMIGVHRRPIDAGYGIPQSAYSAQFAELEDGFGFRIETAPAYPAIAAAVLPSFGIEHRRAIDHFRHLSITIALVRDGCGGEPDSRVILEQDGSAGLEYRLREEDRAHLLDGMRALAQLQFAAGAHQVFSLHAEPLVLSSPRDLPLLAERGVVEHELALFSAHPQGGCALGRDPQRSVCGWAGQVHGVAGLHVCDGSLFPLSVGVNPQITIMALARRTAQAILRRT